MEQRAADEFFIAVPEQFGMTALYERYSDDELRVIADSCAAAN